MYRTNKIIATLVASFMIGSIGWMPCSEAASRTEIAQISVNQKGSNFKYWQKGSAVLAQLRDYVQKVTNPKDKDFILVRDRIAVFDVDGTLVCETAPFCFDFLMMVDRALYDSSYTASARDAQILQA